jgi:uncharacterized protein
MSPQKKIEPEKQPSPPEQELVPAPVLAISPADERTWAMLAHLSILINLFSAVLGPVAALVIYLIYKDRSRYVAYHSLQALLFQLVAWVGGGVLTGIAWTVVGVLSAVLIGICLIPFAMVITAIPIAALCYGVYAAIQTNQGRDFKYWLVGDWVRSTYTS